MNNFCVGELIYVPSQSMLYNDSKTHKLEKPTNLLIIGKNNSKYAILTPERDWFLNDTFLKSAKILKKTAHDVLNDLGVVDPVLDIAKKLEQTALEDE